MIKKLILIFLLCLSFFSCKTGDTRTQWIYTQGKLEGTFHVDHRNQAILTLPYSSRTEVSGEAFLEESGDWVFHTDELSLFYNWHNGWTESILSMQGVVILKKTGPEDWKLEILEEPRILSVKEGQIRYKRDRIYGDRARDMMSRRLNRSLALAAMIPPLSADEDYDFHHKKKGYYSEEYIEDLESFLFPERYGFNQAFPEPESDLNKKDRYIKNEEVKWDTSYTQMYFSPDLHDIRNSGTLYRDYEEASQLIILCAQWHKIWNEYLPHLEIQEQ